MRRGRGTPWKDRSVSRAPACLIGDVLAMHLGACRFVGCLASRSIGTIAGVLSMSLKNTTKTVCFLITALLLYGIMAGAHDQNPDSSKGSTFKVLVYSNTGYYRHPDIPKINRWLVLLGHENGFDV